MKISNVSGGLTEIGDAISSKRVLLVLDDVDRRDQSEAVFRMKDQALKISGTTLSALEKLEAIPNGEIVNKLRVSYDSLQYDHDRKLFLHIACFFIGKDKDYIVKILDGCGFYTIVGIQNLIDRCLVTIDEFDKLQMHDMIHGMGREIIRIKSEKPWKRSRVWQHKDAFNILTAKNGTDSIEGLVPDMHMSPRNSHINSTGIVLETNTFARTHKLELLHLSHVQLNGSYAEFCTGLRWLCWNKFALDSIPTDFPLGSLIVLEMQYSGLRQVFKGTKRLSSLKILDLSHSHSLTDTSDFSFCPKLEKLIIADCVSLIYVHGSIGNPERLVYLSMKDCKNLKMLPENICMLKFLETLIISGCTSLNEFSIEMLRNMESLKELHTDGIPIGELRPGRSSCILSSLPCSLVDLSLQGCNLSNDAFPREFSNLSSLRTLNLGNNPICVLPNCIKDFTKLDELSFLRCKNLKSLLGLPKLGKLNVGGCVSLETITYQCSRFLDHSAVLGNNHNLVEWEYEYKLEPIGSVDAEMINLLGLSNLESMAPIRMCKRSWMSRNWRNPDWSPVQGLYEKYIFSTFFAGNEVPGQFSHKSSKSPISFTVPLLDNHRIQGLKVFAVYTNCTPMSSLIVLLKVKEFGIQLVQVSTDSYYPCIRKYKPGVYLLSTLCGSAQSPIRLIELLEDSDDEDTRDEEEEQNDLHTIVANNSGGPRGWKVLTTAACFVLTLSLITLSHRKKPETKRRG
ncbi:hypothetical protein L3X38_012827 [Prunus dulcis]|uniref:Disease resistance protein Roq1-like winged-helix domain-containing protein n=1 Tax=Prunus dulcis TaxID=3755 RepID=A0AAD4ZGE7_PRUDU|nr:hypothetical protein L3X38_012827 [Prunus dulcis]